MRWSIRRIRPLGFTSERSAVPARLIFRGFFRQPFPPIGFIACEVFDLGRCSQFHTIHEASVTPFMIAAAMPVADHDPE